MSKGGSFSRGFGEVRKRVSKRSVYTMSCYNCDYFYRDEGDTEELCQNPDVTRYDMVVTEGNIYCSKWSMVKREPSVKSIFKKNKRK